MKRKYGLFIAIAAMLIITAVSYATTYSTGVTTTITAGTDTTITAATNDGNYGVTPVWSAPVTNTNGGVTTAGDLYIVNASTHPADSVIRLYIANTDKLAAAYTNFNARVSLYEENAGVWTLAGATSQETISLNNSVAEFKVAGGKKYSISIDDGNNYCLNAASPDLSPIYMADATN